MTSTGVRVVLFGLAVGLRDAPEYRWLLRPIARTRRDDGAPRTRILNMRPRVVLIAGLSSNLVHNSTRETEHTWPRRYRRCSSMTSMAARLRARSALRWMVQSTRST